jgi:hypothetical protein
VFVAALTLPSRAGCESVFVCGGIHAAELGMSSKAGLSAADVGDGDGVDAPESDAIRALCATYAAAPEYAVPVFKW